MRRHTYTSNPYLYILSETVEAEYPYVVVTFRDTACPSRSLASMSVFDPETVDATADALAAEYARIARHFGTQGQAAGQAVRNVAKARGAVA